jgi:hypothetical protein
MGTSEGAEARVKTGVGTTKSLKEWLWLTLNTSFPQKYPWNP